MAGRSPARGWPAGRIAQGAILRDHDRRPGPLHVPGRPDRRVDPDRPGQGACADLKKLAIGQDRQPVEFRLGPGQTIRGRIVDAHDKPIARAPISVYEWRGHHSLKWSTETDAEGRFRWDEAPADMVLIDVGSLGYYPEQALLADDP